MSWRTVIITTRCKLDLKMGYMVIRGEDTKCMLRFEQENSSEQNYWRNGEDCRIT